MENINRFTVRKQITEHVAGMEFSASAGGGLYFHIQGRDKRIRHTDNIRPSDVYWCKVDALGYNTSLQLEVIGTGILYAVVHPDIYVPDYKDNLKSPMYVVKDDRNADVKSWWFLDEAGYAVSVSFNSLVSGEHKVYATAFVSSLDDLKKSFTDTPEFRMRENPEFHPVRFFDITDSYAPADDVLHGVWFSQAKFNGEIVTE